MQSHKQILEKMFQDAVWERTTEEERQELRRRAKKAVQQEIKEEGMREALQQTLTAQIRQRFGRLPRAAAARIRAAHSDELSGWLQRILQVDSVDELFAGSD